MKQTNKKQLPEWLKKRVPSSGTAQLTADVLKELGLTTVCQSAMCPNVWECFEKKIATFMIMGDRCTRNCRFCGVTSKAPGPLDPDEPRRVAEAVVRFGLKHVVVTSVTRDDLPDGGAGHFAATITSIKERAPHVTIEVLTPDFGGVEKSIRIVAQAGPVIYNHNIETVPRLYSEVRPQAVYRRSLDLIKFVRQNFPKIRTKSGLMVGLGEEIDEIIESLNDLKSCGCDILTIGQYLQPSPNHLEVKEYIPPKIFDQLAENAREIGFMHAYCAPFVRSSYNAADFVETDE
jgi:lipoyl synthase